MPLRPCLKCGRPTDGPRCPEHGGATGGRRASGWERYGPAWRAAVAAAIERQPWCTECGATQDLTGDHITPRSHGGRDVSENIEVLCRPCNSRRGTRGDDE